MGYKIVCEQFKSPYFSNGNHARWGKRVKQCQEIAQAECSQGTVDLFYSLASHGYAHTVIESRAMEVLAALHKRHYDAEIKRTEVVSMGQSLWQVDSEALANGKFVGREIVSDITKEVEHVTGVEWFTWTKEDGNQ